jgi:hypothetical protein
MSQGRFRLAAWTRRAPALWARAGGRRPSSQGSGPVDLEVDAAGLHACPRTGRPAWERWSAGPPGAVNAWARLDTRGRGAWHDPVRARACCRPGTPPAPCCGGTRRPHGGHVSGHADTGRPALRPVRGSPRLSRVVDTGARVCGTGVSCGYGGCAPVCGSCAVGRVLGGCGGVALWCCGRRWTWWRPRVSCSVRWTRCWVRWCRGVFRRRPSAGVCGWRRG